MKKKRFLRASLCSSDRTRFVAVLATVLVIGSACTGPSEADSVEPSVQQNDIPRTPSGRPDFNGIWQALGNAHWNIEAHMASAALAVQPGPMGPVPAGNVLAFGAVGAIPSGQGIVVGGEIPYLPEALVKKIENQENWVERDPEIKCYLPGVPRATYMQFPFQIFQSDAKFFITYEYASAQRDIYLEDPGPAEVDSWMGQSVGRWEGDTFVVDVTGLHDGTWFDRAGNHHSYMLTVTERYTLTGPDHILYEATIEDPATFSRPWTIRLPLYRNISENARLGQFKCVEYVEELIYGELRKNPIER
ncbi:MAG: hypothetical protein O6931_07310 [Gammaproteobacteria bacterium]|nr:hypothetical protein [Gammaproteobacteria bacterium]